MIATRQSRSQLKSRHSIQAQVWHLESLGSILVVDLLQKNNVTLKICFNMYLNSLQNWFSISSNHICLIILCGKSWKPKRQQVLVGRVKVHHVRMRSFLPGDKMMRQNKTQTVWGLKNLKWVYIVVYLCLVVFVWLSAFFKVVLKMLLRLFLS